MALMFAVAIRYELRLPGVRSLKEKRKIVRHLTDGLAARLRVAVAELGDNDIHQRAQLGVTIVSGTSFAVDKVAHQVEKFIEASPGVEIIDSHRAYLEEE